MNEIIPRLWIGSKYDVDAGVDGFSPLCVLESRPSWVDPRTIHIPILEISAIQLPNGTHVATAIVPQLEAVAVMIDALMHRDLPVLVHCYAGVERSPLAVMWYLARYGHDQGIDAAFARVKTARPKVIDCRSWIPKEALIDIAIV